MAWYRDVVPERRSPAMMKVGGDIDRMVVRSARAREVYRYSHR
jgi:hypothetical protein